MFIGLKIEDQLLGKPARCQVHRWRGESCEVVTSLRRFGGCDGLTSTMHQSTNQARYNPAGAAFISPQETYAGRPGTLLIPLPVYHRPDRPRITCHAVNRTVPVVLRRTGTQSIMTEPDSLPDSHRFCFSFPR